MDGSQAHEAVAAQPPLAAEEPSDSDAPRGLDAARIQFEAPRRDVGFCVLCDDFVERGSKGQCPRGHAPQAVAGRIELEVDEPMPSLPRFNLAAFLIPPLWGLWYGQWVGIMFIPLWIFASNAYEGAVVRGGIWLAIALALFAFNVIFMLVFARRANGLAWRHVCQKQTIATFKRRQLVWAGAAVALWAVAGVWLLAYARGVRF